MTIKLNSVDRWKALKPSQAIMFKKETARTIRLQLNCSDRTALFLQDGDGKDTFLASVPPGVETIEFFVAGKCGVFADGGGHVSYITGEHEPTHVQVLDPVVFTKVAHRRTRNPELEQMMFIMQQNVERRLAAADAENARRLTDLERKYKTDVNVREQGNAGPADVSAAPANQADPQPAAAASGGDATANPAAPSGSEDAAKAGAKAGAGSKGARPAQAEPAARSVGKAD